MRRSLQHKNSEQRILQRLQGPESKHAGCDTSCSSLQQLVDLALKTCSPVLCAVMAGLQAKGCCPDGPCRELHNDECGP